MKYEYLNNTPLEEATKTYIFSLEKAGITYSTELVSTRNALGRVNATALYAKRCSPSFCASAMDGIAIKAESSFGATEQSPVLLSEKQYTMIDTGDPLPENADCVVMIEDVIETNTKSVYLNSAAVPWQNVRQIGEDICMGDMIIPSFTKITPSLIGALLAGGVFEFEAVKTPTVAIIPTGDEIVSAEKELESGDIPEFNSAIFSAMLKEWGANSKVYPVVKDKLDLIEKAIKKAADECDMIIVIAGSSAGRDDYTSTALKEVGTLVIHGVSIKPGKPAVLGFVNKKPFIGVPGYPVSGILVMELFCKKALSLITKISYEENPQIEAMLSRKTVSSLKYREYLRVITGKVGEKITAIPMSRGAGIVSGFAKSSGSFVIEQNSEGFSEGDKINVELCKPLTEIENSVCIVGSHDPLIDEISDIMKCDNPLFSVVSSHVGSMGAIMALKRNEAQLGGIHLFDEKSGEYNKACIKKYFPDGGVTLIKGVIRKQGLMVQKGNPKDIFSVKDIVNTGAFFVNRQKGSGTRILLDFLLKRDNLSKDSIYGYTREEYTHTAVAAIIAQGSADAGLGIYSAAKIYGLDFIPLWDEEYDFLVLNSELNSERVNRFVEILKGEELKKRLKKMGGYELYNAGDVKEL